MPKEILYPVIAALLVAAFSGLAFMAHKYPSLYQSKVVGIVWNVATIALSIILVFDLGVDVGGRAVVSSNPTISWTAAENAADAVKPLGAGTAFLVVIGLLLYVFALLWLSVQWEHERSKQKDTPENSKD